MPKLNPTLPPDPKNKEKIPFLFLHTQKPDSPQANIGSTLQSLNQTMEDNLSPNLIQILQQQLPESLIITKKTQKPAPQNKEEAQPSTDENEIQDTEIEIRNHIATIRGEKVVKLTEIQFDNRTIQIIDSFVCTPISQESEPKAEEVRARDTARAKTFNSNPTLCDKLIDNVATSDGQDDDWRKDLKNRVKIIFKMFQKWVKEHGPSSLKSGDQLDELLDCHGKYNHNLIVKLSKSSLLRDAFLAFSDTQAEKIIGDSKFHDKQSLLDALKKYRKLCLKEQCQIQIEKSEPSRKQESTQEGDKSERNKSM